MTNDRDLHKQLESAARSMQDEADVQDTLDRAAALAPEIVDGCDYAGVTIITRDGEIQTPTASDELHRQTEDLQHALREGPCFDALWTTDTVVSPDLATDDRWPRWAPRAVEELGTASMVCYQLFVTEQSLGSLNLYSRRRNAFDDDAVEAGTHLAAHVAVALAASQESEQLHSALATRTTIGQAEGILMERFDVSADRAFAILRRVSQDSNVKVRDVATRLVQTRKTPGV